MSSVVIVTVVTQETISQVHQTVHLIICKLYFSKTDLQARMGMSSGAKNRMDQDSQRSRNKYMCIFVFLLKDLSLSYHK